MFSFQYRFDASAFAYQSTFALRASADSLRAKTGSLSSVASLSGYVTTAGGEHLVFSMMLNNYPDAAAVRRDSIDAIAVLLASFTGKSQP